MDKWQFEYTPGLTGSGTWQWVRAFADGTGEVSEQAFETFYACEADARRHGYAEGKGINPAASLR